MRSVTLERAISIEVWSTVVWPDIARLAWRLRIAVSAIALGMAIAAPRARAGEFDIDSVDELNTATIASRQRLEIWDNNRTRGSGGGITENNLVKPIGGQLGNYRLDANQPGNDGHDGIPMGSYLISPEAGAIVVYNDNIYGRDKDKTSDWQTETTGKVTFKSELPRHVLDFSLDGKIVNYAEHTDQDHANIRAKVQGALHFDHATTLSASLLSALEHEERGGPAFPLAANEPVSVFHNRIAAGITRDVGRLYGTISAAAESWDYHDVQAVNGWTLDQDSRDTQIYSGQIRTGYRISPGFDFITKLRTYRQENTGTPALDRDAWGYEAMAGLAFETNPLLRWHIMGGFSVRDFDQAKVANFATSILEAGVQWLPTQRLSVYAAVSQTILEETEITSSATVSTGGELKAKYEIYHNLALTGSAGFHEEDYKGTDRTDYVYSARTGLEYLLSNNLLFTFGYEHQVRDSSDDSNDMHRNRFMLGAKLRF
jgi:hypothetical protein